MLRVCFHFLFQIYSESSSTFLQIYSTSTFSWLVMTFLNWGSTKGVSPSTHTERSLSVLKIVDILWQEKKNLRNQLTQKKKKKDHLTTGGLSSLGLDCFTKFMTLSVIVWFLSRVLSGFHSQFSAGTHHPSHCLPKELLASPPLLTPCLSSLSECLLPLTF